jgi:hypothetical protein
VRGTSRHFDQTIPRNFPALKFYGDPQRLCEKNSSTTLYHNSNSDDKIGQFKLGNDEKTVQSKRPYNRQVQRSEIKYKKRIYRLSEVLLNKTA